MSEIQRYDFSSDGHYPSNSGGWVDADEAEAKIKQLEQDLAEAKKDQARYQWLRNEVLVDGEINDSLYVACDSDKYTGRWALVGDELDQAIDAAYEALQKENERLTKCLVSANSSLEEYERKYYLEINKVEDLQAENEAQAKRIAELEAATEHLGLTPQQAKDGLARHKAQVAEIEALRKQVEEHKEWHMMRDEMRKALEAQMNG